MVMSFKHNTAKVSTGIEVHYVEAGDPSDPCVVLIHGYPQTWYMYRHVIHNIAKAGYHVIAPDYRGAGQTSLSPTQDDKENTGYDKFSMAADLHALYKEVLGVDKAFIVGIDIGSMVATALALRFREDVIGLFASECPQPGTKAYDISTTSDVWKYERVYHFFFHTAPDLPEALTEGKEGLYIKSFYDRLTSKPDFLTPSDQAEYTSAFSAPGRMKAGFEVYRAFRKDCKDVQREIEERGKLSKEVPVLASGGEKSPLSELAHGMMQELAENVTFELVPDSMHWIPEENPEGFVELLTRWMSQVREGQK